MKATPHTHPNSKLIADIFVAQEESVTNRRGHAMNEMHETPVDTHYTPQHECHEHTPVPTRPHAYTKLTLARHSALPTMLYKLKNALPAWSPKKFTAANGVETNWEAVLPSKQTLTNAGLLTSFLVIGAFAVWAMPQKNPPQVIAEKPTHVSKDVSQAPASQPGVLTATTVPTASAQTTGWRLVMGRTSSPTKLPSVASASSPTSTTTPASTAPASQSTSSSSDTSQPTSTSTTPSTGSDTSTTTPTDTSTPVTTTPTDPTTQPVDPPVVIVDPPSIEELLGLSIL